MEFDFSETGGRQDRSVNAQRRQFPRSWSS